VPEVECKTRIFTSLCKQVANYQAASTQLGQISAAMHQIDENEEEIDQLHCKVINEID
jgi:hypothetical protein